MRQTLQAVREYAAEVRSEEEKEELKEVEEHGTSRKDYQGC